MTSVGKDEAQLYLQLNPHFHDKTCFRFQNPKPEKIFFAAIQPKIDFPHDFCEGKFIRIENHDATPEKRFYPKLNFNKSITLLCQI
jgi:hypothetical protein